MALPKSLTTVTTFSKTLALVLFITLPILGFYFGMEYQKGITPELPPITTPTPTGYPSPSLSVPSGNRIICTMEARLCPDGSHVGRSGPNCEFAKCPNLDD